MNVAQQMDKAFAVGYPKEALQYVRPLLDEGAEQEVKDYLFELLTSGTPDDKWQALTFLYFIFGKGAEGRTEAYNDTQRKICDPPTFGASDVTRLLYASVNEEDYNILECYAALIKFMSLPENWDAIEYTDLLRTAMRHIMQNIETGKENESKNQSSVKHNQ